MPRLDALEVMGEPGDVRETMEVAPAQGGVPLRALAWTETRDAAEPIHEGFVEAPMADASGAFLPSA